MSEMMISDLITVLQQPGSMPRAEEERQILLTMLLVILPNAPYTAQPTSRHSPDVLYNNPSVQLDNDDNAESIWLKDWLKDLREVAYDASGILAKFRCAELLAEEIKCHRSGDKVRAGLFSHFKISNIKLPFFKKGAAGALQGDENRIHNLVLRIDDIVRRALNFQQNQEQDQEVITSSQPPQLQNFQNPTDFGANITVGIDKKIEKIVEFLLDPTNTTRDTINAVSITGLMGSGKTILAQSVCGNPRIINYFECILWVEVELQTNIAQIAKIIIDRSIGKDCCIPEGDTDLLFRRLYQELSGKRSLLVLNCKWHSTHIEELLEKFILWLQKCAGSENSLIVTSPCKVDESLCFTNHYNCPVRKLSKNDMQFLFAKRAFADGQEPHPEILEMAEKIVFRCKGSPQLVNLMGSLMRFKKDPEEWREVINYLKRDQITIHCLLQLCYLNMSSETKQCFTFCFVFPKGYYMDKEVLIKLWMANGLFSSDGLTSLEKKGNMIFDELVLRHIFEDVQRVPIDKYGNQHGYGSRVVCKMAEILHSLNVFKESEKCCDDPKEIENGSQFQYLSIPGDSQINVPALLEKNQQLHALIFRDDPFVRSVNCSVLPVNSLKALHLHSALFVKDLFDLKQLTLLRYLDLSGSRIKKLPENFSSLILLQTLNLSRCLLLCELPHDMRFMTKLRHLYVHGCPKLKKMPAHLRQLICLTILTTYIVGESAGVGIDELKGFNLTGLLELYNLSKVKNITIAKEVDLVSKVNLDMLTFCWGTHRLVMSNENNDLDLLEALKPHNGLKVLKIQQYGSHEFATWLADPVGLLNLVELHLIGCPKCEKLPAVWKLSSLNVLCLKHMSSITSFSAGRDEEYSSEPFQGLKKLVLLGMKKLERWHSGQARKDKMLSFPMLNELEITHCPELITLPSVPVLKYLTVSTENQGLVTSVIDLVTQSENIIEVNLAKGNGSDHDVLFELRVEVEGLNRNKLRVMRLNSTNSFFTTRVIQNLRLPFWRSLVSLEKLDISNCTSIVTWPLEEFRNMRKLKQLSLRMCPNLTGLLPRRLQEGEELLPRLQSLEFYRCLSLEEVPLCSSILYLELDECPKINSISGLNNLEMLSVSCTSWKTLPTGFKDLKKLESLRVSECYSLACLPNELAGLTSLRTLIINKCQRVNTLPGGLNQLLSHLEKFQILGCPELEKFCGDGPYSSIISQINKSDRADALSPDEEPSNELLVSDGENQSDYELSSKLLLSDGENQSDDEISNELLVSDGENQSDDELSNELLVSDGENQSDDELSNLRKWKSGPTVQRAQSQIQTVVDHFTSNSAPDAKIEDEEDDNWDLVHYEGMRRSFSVTKF